MIILFADLSQYLPHMMLWYLIPVWCTWKLCAGPSNLVPKVLFLPPSWKDLGCSWSRNYAKNAAGMVGARLNLVTSAIKFYRLEGQIASALCSQYWQKFYTWASPSISKHQNVDIIQNNFNTNLDSGVKLSYSSCCPKESICCRFLLKDSIWKEQLLHQVRRRSLESSQIRTTPSFSHWNGWHVEKSQVSQNYHPI